MKATFGKSGKHNNQRMPTLSATLDLNPAGSALHLQHDQHIHVHDAAGWSVKALRGTLWITQDGDVRDVVLEAGQEFILDRNGLALLTSLGETNICVAYGANRCTTRSHATEGKVKPEFSPALPSFA
jgi:hypothetical protein